MRSGANLIKNDSIVFLVFSISNYAAMIIAVKLNAVHVYAYT